MRVVRPRTRTLIAMAAVLAPAGVRRFLHRRLLGYEIDPTAQIGRSLIDVDAFRAGPRAVVKSLSVIRGLERVELAADSHIGPLNWVNAIRLNSTEFLHGRPRETTLVLERAAAITSMHFIDCCDRVEVGEFSAVGGMMSQLLTHSFDYRNGEQRVAPIRVGAYSIVGTKSLLLPGTQLGDRCIVGGGSVLTGGVYDGLVLYAGVPAVAKSKLDPEAKLFTRTDPKIR